MSEIENIRDRYKRRENTTKAVSSAQLYDLFMQSEREKIYRIKILNHFENIKDLKVLEIGAGGGSNINFFKVLGIPPHNIYANELLEDRIDQLKINHPDIHIIKGDACIISEDEKFDIVFQSTVFTSILDNLFRIKLADKMRSLVKKDGIILWYDFVYNNPSNKDVKKVTRAEIRKLFNGCKSINYFAVTLAPPIGRKIGRLYSIVNNVFPFLRTHVIAVIEC